MSLVEDDPATRAPSRMRDVWTLCGVVVLVMATVSMSNLSVPVLAASPWAPSTVQLTWYVDAYVIAFACFLLPADMLGSRFGLARVLLIGLTVFAAANAVAAFAPSIEWLIATRVVAGAGAAAALPQTLSILLRRAPAGRRAPVVAAWTASTSIAGVVGNGLGGPLIGSFGWRSIFVVSSPIAVLLVVLVVLVVRVDRPSPAAASSRVDVRGMALFMVAAVALLVLVIEAPSAVDGPVVLLVAGAVALLAGIPFVAVELRSRAPMVDLRVFAEARTRAAALGIVTTFTGLFALFALNAHVIQTARGLGPAVAGLSLVPISVTMFLVTYATVPLVRRFGLGAVVAVGMIVSASGYLLVVHWSVSASLAVYEVGLVVVGAGAGLCSSPLSTQLTSPAGHALRRAGAGLNSTLRELASAVGIGVAGVALTVTTSAEGSAITDEAVLRSLDVVLTGVAALLVVATVVMLVDTRIHRSDSGEAR